MTMPNDRGPLRRAAGGPLVAAQERMRRAGGFTVLEMVVTVAILAALAALAYPALSLMRPRATFADVSAEVAGLLYNARQNALATGHYTVVMVFPNQANLVGGTGRLVAYEDETFKFMTTTATPRFDGWDASKTAGVAAWNLVGSVELPRGITFGLGGAAAPSLPAPYDAVTATACNFCKAGGDGRGAVVFDSRGRAQFFPQCGPALSLGAGTLALTASPAISGYRLFLITPSTGAVRPYGPG
jgi:prepilin-type N-terminal cleavage/methylation domain-containing protein